MTNKNLKKTGYQMEEVAATYLSEHGVKILERNYRSREAEIDIIGEQAGILLFIEVKARQKGERSGAASEAVGTAKQKRICRCAEYYLYSRKMDPYSTSMRFDVVAITVGEEENKIRWIQNAFFYVPYNKSKPHWRVW